MNHPRRSKHRTFLLPLQVVCTLLVLAAGGAVVWAASTGQSQSLLIAVLLIFIGLLLVLFEVRERLRRDDRRNADWGSFDAPVLIQSGVSLPRPRSGHAAFSGSQAGSAAASTLRTPQEVSGAASSPGSGEDWSRALLTMPPAFSEPASHGHHGHADHGQSHGSPASDSGGSSSDTGGSGDSGGTSDSGGC